MAQFSLEDELDDVKPKPTPAAATPAKNTKATATPAKAKVVDDDAEEQVVENLDVEFGDEKLATRPDALPRCRPTEKGKVARFGILPFVKPKAGKNHFIEEPKDIKGTYRCISKDNVQARCDEGLGEDGELHVIALVCRYLNVDSKSGILPKGTALEWELQYVDLSRSNYASVGRLPEEDQTVYDIDINMFRNDRAFGYDFTKISSKALWRRNPELAKEVEAAAEKFLDGKKLVYRLGKKMDEITWKALLQRIKSGGAEEPSIADIDADLT